MKLKRIWPTLLLTLGAGVVAAGVGMISTPLGIVVLGVELMALGTLAILGGDTK